MAFPLTLTTPDGATVHSLLVPTCWADVTLAQFVALFAPVADESRSQAEVLVGLPAGGLGQLAFDDVAYLSTLLAFATDPADVLALLPTPGLPDIGTLPYGSFLLAQQHVQGNADRPALASMPHLLALYRQTMLWGNADNSARLAACEEALLAAPVTEVYADAAFFLNCYQQLVHATRPTRPTTTSPKTRKSTRALKSLANGSGRFSAWMRRLAAPS
jgi:hypothetical protein